MRMTLAFAAAVALTSAFPASAAPTFFSDAATFDAATGPLAGFEGFNDARPNAATQVYNGFSLSETGGVNIVVHLINFPGAFDSAIIEGGSAASYDDNGLSLGTFSFDNPITAFGLWVTRNSAGSVAITGDGGATSIDLLADTPAFFGLINMDGFSTVVFDAAGDPLVGFDALRFGDAAVIPEPATWAMLIVGFGLVGFAARRRQAAVTA